MSSYRRHRMVFGLHSYEGEEDPSPLRWSCAESTHTRVFMGEVIDAGGSTFIGVRVHALVSARATHTLARLAYVCPITGWADTAHALGWQMYNSAWALKPPRTAASAPEGGRWPKHTAQAGPSKPPPEGGCCQCCAASRRLAAPSFIGHGPGWYHPPPAPLPRFSPWDP